LTTVAISQSNYLPWRGYFSQIETADYFVFLDNVQFTKRDWRTRNQIITPQGAAWINVPISPPKFSFSKINEIEIPDFNFLEEHLEIIRRSYSRAINFENNWNWFSDLLSQSQSNNLSKFNTNIIKHISQKFDLETNFYNSSVFQNSDDATQRLINICVELGAEKYLSGPSAKNYLDVSRFHDLGIEVIWADYNFSEYKQLWTKKFQPNVSIIDAILNEGFSRNLLKSNKEI
jgi:hypothetical protein